MASLHDLLCARLENVKPTPDGWQARCPMCAAHGEDRTGNHLRIWRSAAFNCAKAGPEAKEHNKGIRAFIYEGADSATLAAMDFEIIDPEPKIVADKVYPEEMLTKLNPDHTYWVNRGINVDVLRKLEGGLAPAGEASKMSNRYLFPIRDPNTKRIMGWTGRLVSDASFGPKHKHLVRVSRAVYPLNVTREAILRTRKVTLLEGVGDGLAVATADIWNYLLLLGLNLNSRILGFLISAQLKEIRISSNNDSIGKPESNSAGNKAAWKLRDQLLPYFGPDVVKVDLPQTRKDWCKTLEDNTGELAAFKERMS